MVPATGTFEPGHPWRGKPTFEIKYDKPAAQKLMQEAGYGPNKHLSVKIQTSASGSGQMLPLPMNEYLQQALAECYFDVQLDVIEWNTLFTNWRRGAKDPSANGANATNGAPMTVSAGTHTYNLTAVDKWGVQATTAGAFTVELHVKR